MIFQVKIFLVKNISETGIRVLNNSVEVPLAVDIRNESLIIEFLQKVFAMPGLIKGLVLPVLINTFE